MAIKSSNISSRPDRTPNRLGTTLRREPRRSVNEGDQDTGKPALLVVERISRQTGAKHYFAYDPDYNVVADEERLDRITRRVQKLLTRYSWDFTLTKVDGNWTPPRVQPTPEDSMVASTGNFAGQMETAHSISWMPRDLGSVRVIELRTDDWIALAEHPRRVSLSKHKVHCRATKKRRMQNPLRFVLAAKLGDRLWKVDGHRRAHDWQQGLLLKPDTVIATVIEVASYRELLRLRPPVRPASRARLAPKTHLNALLSTDSTAFSDPQVRNALIGALRIVMRGAARLPAGAPPIDYVKVHKRFTLELQQLSQLPLTATLLQPGILAAALLCLPSAPDDLHFFELVAREAGAKRAGKPDIVEALLMAASNCMTRPGYTHLQQVRLCRFTLQAVALWRKQQTSGKVRWMDTPLQPVPSLRSYMEALRRLRSLDGEL